MIFYICSLVTFIYFQSFALFKNGGATGTRTRNTSLEGSDDVHFHHRPIVYIPLMTLLKTSSRNFGSINFPFIITFTTTIVKKKRMKINPMNSKIGKSLIFLISVSSFLFILTYSKMKINFLYPFKSSSLQSL